MLKCWLKTCEFSNFFLRQLHYGITIHWLVHACWKLVLHCIQQSITNHGFKCEVQCKSASCIIVHIHCAITTWNRQLTCRCIKFKNIPVLFKYKCSYHFSIIYTPPYKIQIKHLLYYFVANIYGICVLFIYSISQMTSLEELVVIDNDLCRDNRLSDTLSKLTSLKKLDMTMCELSRLPDGWVDDKRPYCTV